MKKIRKKEICKYPTLFSGGVHQKRNALNLEVSFVFPNCKCFITRDVSPWFICLHRNKIIRPYQLVEIQFENRYDGIRLAGKLGQITCVIDTTQKLSCSKSFWFTTSFKILNTYNYSRIKASSQIFDSVPNTFLRRVA